MTGCCVARCGRVSCLPSPSCLTAVLLRGVQGLSTFEASALLGVKTQTLKSRLHRGRLILRARLADFADGLAMRSTA